MNHPEMAKHPNFDNYLMGPMTPQLEEPNQNQPEPDKHAQNPQEIQSKQPLLLHNSSFYKHPCLCSH